MRRLLAAAVLAVVLGSSLLVWSAERDEREVMRYADVLADYAPFRALGLSAAEGWRALAGLYPQVEGKPVTDPGAVNHLVEIYLRSRGLAPCGHVAEHETVGTPCSFSAGTPLHALYLACVGRLRAGGALSDRAALYLMESEPADWGATTRTAFLFEGRVVPATTVVTDADVDRRRAELVAEGFQTATTWSAEEIRRSILRTRSGESLADIDRQLGVARGEVKRTLVNFVVRPLHLLLSHAEPTFEGSLTGLPGFVAENGGRALHAAELSQLRVQAPQLFAATPPPPPPPPPPLPVAVVVRAAEPAPAPAPAERDEKAREKPEEKQEEKIREGAPTAKPSNSFACSYGGTRFGLGWAR